MDRSWSGVTKEGKDMVEERDVLSPEGDDMSVMVVGVMVATRTDVTGDGGEQNTGLTMRSF